MEKTVEVVVEGGKATPAPPLGPALGPLGVNIVKVVGEINEKTKELAGMKVPVKVILDTGTKKYRLEIGKPPASALILKEAKAAKGSSFSGKDRAGDITMEQARKIARAKFGSDEAPYLNQILGTCRSMGVTIEKGALTDAETKAAKEHKEQMKEAATAKKGGAGEGAAAAEAAPAAK